MSLENRLVPRLQAIRRAGFTPSWELHHEVEAGLAIVFSPYEEVVLSSDHMFDVAFCSSPFIFLGTETVVFGSGLTSTCVFDACCDWTLQRDTCTTM